MVGIHPIKKGPIARPRQVEESLEGDLELHSETELHVARSIRLTGDLAKRRRAGQAEARTARLEVVQDVRNLEEHLGMDSLFVDTDVLDDVHVDVPGGKTTEGVIAAAA